MKKALSVLLILMLLTSAVSVLSLDTVYADQGTETSGAQNPEEFALPDIVPEEEAIERGYIGRVKEEEKDNYTFVFKDSENMRTMRVYSHPVKYTDKDGNTKDITLDIQSRPGGGFETKDNSIKTTFGAKLSDGIRLQSEDVDIKLIPANSLNQATLSEDNKTVSYTLDTKTTLEYSLTYTGFKEDIVVKEYTGQTEYEFLLYTNGLSVKEEMGSFYLADAEGNRKANIGDIIIFTADERNNTLGKLSCIEIKEDQIYGLTIHVDAEYLKDEKTVYPIRIDPTLEVTGTGAIEDVTVRSGSTTYSGNWGLLYVGRIGSEQFRTLMRFPGLEIPVDFPEMITSAKIELRDVMCQGTHVPIICTPYPAIAAGWSESTTSTWGSTQQHYTSNKVLDEQVVYYGNGNVPGIPHRYAFDITEEAKNWVTGPSTPDRGVVFRMSDSFAAQTPSTTQDELKYFGSYNRSDYQPSLTIEYSHIAIYLITQKVDSVTRYLSAEMLGSSGVQALTNEQVVSRDPDEGWLTPEYYGKTMWAVEYYPANDAYRVLSMGVKTGYGEFETGVYITDDAVGLATIYLSGNYTLFTVAKTSNGYRLRNKATSEYLALSADNILTASTSTTTNTNFIFEAIEVDTFNNYWPGSYNVGIYNGVAHIKVVVETSAYSNPTIEEDYFESVNVWNNLSDNVIIYGPGETVPSGITPFVVTFRGKNFSDSYTAASTVGINANGVTAEQLGSVTYENWSSVIIYISNTIEFSETDAKKTIAHEMGHALKLAHPWQCTNLQSVENGRGGYSRYGIPDKGNNRVLALMNQDIATASNNLSACAPKIHDIINLRNKWGG